MKKVYIKPTVELLKVAVTSLVIASYGENISDEMLETPGEILSKDYKGHDVWDDPYY